MSRKVLLAALAAATALSSWAAYRELACSACGGGRIPLGLIGAGFYGGALVSTIAFGLRRSLAFSLFAAFGLHLGLVGLMVSRGPICPTCLLTAGASVVAVAAVLVRDRTLMEPAAAIAPWTAAAAFILPIHPAVRDIEMPSTPGAPIQIAIYSRDGCRYCEQLRDEVLPQALAGISDKVDVRWLPAPPSTPAPGIVLVRAGRPGGRYLEGLPPPAFLREEIDKLLEVRP